MQFLHLTCCSAGKHRQYRKCDCPPAELNTAGQSRVPPGCQKVYDVVTRCCGECYTWVAKTTDQVARHVLGPQAQQDAIGKLVRQLETGNCGEGLTVGSHTETMVQSKPGLIRFPGVYLPHWILHPVNAEVKVIQQLWKWYTFGWLPGGLLDLWIECVFPIYLQDTSLGSECFCEEADSKVHKIILEAEQPACGVEDTRWYTVHGCSRGQSGDQGEHAHLQLKKTCRNVPLQKSSVAQWLKAFPVSSTIDFEKQRLHVHTILRAYRSEYQSDWVRRANEVLANIPIGNYNIPISKK